MTPIARLHGARIRRIDAPSDELLTLTLATPTYKGVLVISLAPKTPGVGLVAKRPHGQSASAFVLKLRKELAGARIEAFSESADARLELHALRGDGTKRLVVDFAARPSPNIALLDAEAHVLIALRPASSSSAGRLSTSLPWPATIEALEAAGAALLVDSESSALEARRVALLRGVTAVDKRIARKLESMAADAARADQAPELRSRATLLLSHLGQIPRGARSVSLVDYTLDPPGIVEITLDPAQDARSQAEALFHRAKRFERGAKIAMERAIAVRAERNELALLRDALLSATDTEALDALATTAKKLGVTPREAPSEAKTKHAPKTRQPYREFHGAEDRTILVGRGAADNDELTLRHARPHDLWLHARDTSGAHVIVPLDRGEACLPDLLRDAALLAAHFSSTRAEAVVDIVYTPRRYITKPRASAPGSVRVEREKVFRLHQDPPRLQHLLTTEPK